MITPLRDNLYILPMKDKEMIGSLYVPDMAQQRVDQGIVMYRGPLTTGEVVVGDHVLFSGYDGTQIVVEGIGLLYVVEEMYIQLVFNDEEVRYLFTKAQVMEMVKKAKGDSEARDFEFSFTALDYMEEKLANMITNHTTREASF